MVHLRTAFHSTILASVAATSPLSILPLSAADPPAAGDALDVRISAGSNSAPHPFRQACVVRFLDVRISAGSNSAPVEVRIVPIRHEKPWNEGFRAAVDRLFDFLDRDGDGSLSAVESARIPLPFEVRRLLWGACFPPAGGLDGTEVDASGDGKVDRDELRKYYDRRSVGLTAASGTAPLSDRLTARLVELLDADKDGAVSAAELDGGWKALLPLDLNEDELVTPSELVGGALYPGAVGGTLMLPVDGAAGRRVSLDGPEAKPAAEAKPASEGASGEPALVWEAFVAAEGAAAGSPSRKERRPGLRLLFWSDEGGAPKAVAAAARSFQDQFREADVDRDGKIAAAELQRNQRAPLRNLIAFADRDGDGVLAEAELEAYLKVSSELARGQTLVTVLDFGKGFFEAIDEDASGALSAVELAAARERLTADGAMVEGVLKVERLPRTVRIAVACGHPRTSHPPIPPRGPAWFVGMDRNGDGAVSRREFLGGDAPFAKLDADGDGFVSPKEAEAARKGG